MKMTFQEAEYTITKNAFIRGRLSQQRVERNGRVYRVFHCHRHNGQDWQKTSSCRVPVAGRDCVSRGNHS